MTAAFVGLPVEALDAVVDDVFELQDRYGGHLWPVEVGDKGCILLLLWGAPVRYEGDSERALGLLEELRRRHPQVRAGAAHGTAFVGFAGPPAREDYVVYGSHVNLAARLMGAAGTGEALLSQDLATRTGDTFALGAAGSRRLKGFAEPVTVHALAGARAGADRDRPFVDHVADLAALERFLAATERGDSPGVALVAGEPGIGKSALVAEARRRFGSRHDGVRWLVTAADPVWRGALQPLRRMAFDVLAQSPHDDREANEARFDLALRDLRLDAERPFLGALVDLYWPGSAWETAEPAARQRRTLDAITAMLRALSERSALVLHLDDVHWADLETRAFLPELLGALADRPFAVVATSRPPADGTAPLAGMRPALELALQKLAGGDLGELAAGVLGESLAPDSVAWLEGRTGGNPFFAEQLLLHLHERGLLVQAPDGLSADAAGAALPPTVDEVVVARLDDLPAEVRRTVRTAAVLGARADVRELRRVLALDGFGGIDVERAGDVAAARGVWVRARSTLEFTHALVRDAAYGTLLVSTRRRLHAAAAAAIEELNADRLGPHLHRLARHHAEAGAIGRAVACERGAADRALGLGAYREAGEYAESGLALAARPDAEADGGGDELGLWLALGASRIVTRGQSAPETKEAYDRAAALSDAAQDTREGFRALFGLRTFYLFAGDHARSLEMAERSLAIAERIGEDDLRVQAHLMVGNARFWVGDLERAERHLAVVEERLPADRHTSHLSGFAQDPRFTALFPAALARRLLGDGDAALRMTEKGLQEARALGHRFSEAMVLQVLGFLHFLDGRPAAAHDAARDLVALAREHGFPMYVAIGSLQLGWARARLGEVDAGLTLVVETAARMREGGTRVAGTLIGALLADAHLAAGRPEDGLIAVEEALADAAARHELAFVDELERLRGELLREAETRSERWSG